MILAEEFSGTQLNRNLWYPCYVWAEQYNFKGCTNNQRPKQLEFQYYQPDDVAIRDGLLILKAQRRSVFASEEEKTFDYTSGMISSHGRFEFTYGYAEARMRLAQGQGFWPGFWMIPVESPNAPELDMMEHLGDPKRYSAGCLYTDSKGYRNIEQKWVNTGNSDLINQFHTYGILWDPSFIKMYFDGVEVFSSRNCVGHVPYHLILNFAIGGWDGVAPGPSTVVPNWIEADYVRVWQRY